MDHVSAKTNHNIAIFNGSPAVNGNKFRESYHFFVSFHHGEPFKNTFNAIDFFKTIAC